MSLLSGPLHGPSRRLPLVAALLALSLTSSSLSLAQSNAPSRADVLFREGRDATKKQDHALACQKFAESYSLDAAPGTLVNLGSCEEKLGKVSQAWHHLTDAVQQLPSTDDRLPVARSLLEGLDAKVARLTVAIAGADEGSVKVLVDGLEVSSADRRGGVVLDPGEHVVLGRTRDGREARQVVQPKAGQKLEVPLTFAPVATVPTASATSEAPSPPPPPPPPGPSRGRRIGTFVDLGLGVVGLGVGAVFGFASSAKTSEARKICAGTERACSFDDVSHHKDLVDASKTDRTIAIVGLTAGGLMVVSGVVLLLTAPSGRAPSTGLRVLPEVGPRSAGLSLGGAW